MSISTSSDATPRTQESRELLMHTYTHDPDALSANDLSVALIGPQELRRKAVASTLVRPQANVSREFSSYPDLDDLPRILQQGYDVIIVELDSNPEHALDLVEHICGNSSATVMVYSAHADPEMLVRCMRAGAREYLTQPIAQGTIAEALVRAAVRRSAAHPPKKTGGKLLVFMGAKGGSGVTTIACNFAVSLARESKQSTALVDLALPLGDAALNLGITPEFSTVNAIQSSSRLDSNFLSTILVKHSSGLFVLAAPDQYSPVSITTEAIEKLFSVLRQEFEYVVVDAGTSLGPECHSLIEAATAVYLVAQVSVTELRNANRIASQFFAANFPKLEIVLNRFTPRSLGIDEENITKALTKPARWKIPSDYAEARKAQNTATPLVLEDSSISRTIREMAKAACGSSPPAGKRKRFGLFG